MHLQSRSATAVANFVDFCAQHQLAQPPDKIVRNLCTFLCQDVEQTPTFTFHRKTLNGVLSFAKSSSGAAPNGKDAKQAEDPAKARLSRRGARLAFEKLSVKFGPTLLESVPKMWQAMAGGLLSACATGAFTFTSYLDRGRFLVLTLSPTAPLPPPELIPLGLASYALPLATNVMATGLIVGKLLWMIRSPIVAVGESAPIFTSGYGAVRHAAEIIVESGVLYLITQLVFVVLYAINHPALAIQTTIAVQVYVSLRAARRGQHGTVEIERSLTSRVTWVCRASRRRSSSCGLPSGCQALTAPWITRGTRSLVFGSAHSRTRLERLPPRSRGRSCSCGAPRT